MQHVMQQFQDLGNPLNCILKPISHYIGENVTNVPNKNRTTEIPF